MKRIISLALTVAMLFSLCAVGIPAAAAGTAARAGGTHYYVSLAGRAGNAGTSEAAPLPGLRAVPWDSLQPGDQVLLHRGETFTGYIHLVGRTGVTVGAYGDAGSALPVVNGGGQGVWYQDAIAAHTDSAQKSQGYVSSTVLLYDCDDITVENLEVTNQVPGEAQYFQSGEAAARTMDRTGVAVVAKEAGASARIVLQGLNVHDVTGNPQDKYMANGGIHFAVLKPVDSAGEQPKFTDAQVKNCTVSHVTGAGIALTTYNGGAQSTGVVITGNTVTDASGTGIQLVGALAPTLQNNQATTDITEDSGSGGGTATQYQNYSRTGWTATAGSSETSANSFNTPEYALDDDLATIWHTAWNGCQPSQRWICVDMKTAQPVAQLIYTPRQNTETNLTGKILSYRVEVSTDNANWTTAAEGAWSGLTSAYTDAQTIPFTQTFTARYVKLTGVETVQDACSAADIQIAGPVAAAALSGESGEVEETVPAQDQAPAQETPWWSGEEILTPEVPVMAGLAASPLAAAYSAATYAAAKTYYVSSRTGSDANDGLSAQTPFFSLARVNALTLNPGDRVLLERGSVWTGETLSLWGQKGTAAASIVIDAYGAGAKPVINAKGQGVWYQNYRQGFAGSGHNWRDYVSSAVLLYDCEYIEVQNLAVENWGGVNKAAAGETDYSAVVVGELDGLNPTTARTNPSQGVSLDPRPYYNYGLKMARTGVAVMTQNIGTADHTHLKNLEVENVYGNVYDKHLANGGIYVIALGPLNESATGVSRYDDVLVEGCYVNRVSRWGIGVGCSSYDGVSFGQSSGDNDISDHTAQTFGSTNLVVRGNYLEDVGGDPITVFNAFHPVVEYNVAYHGSREITPAVYSEWKAGERIHFGRVAAGIWPWKCKSALFRYNECYAMLHGDGGSDAKAAHNGDGMAWDADSGDSTLYEYNYSALNSGGCIMFCYTNAYNSVFRYNISYKDGTASSSDNRGPLDMSSNPNGVLYNNTFVMLEGQKVYYHRNGHARAENNIFYALGEAGDGGWSAMTGTAFDHNLYLNFTTVPSGDAGGISVGDPTAVFATQPTGPETPRSTAKDGARVNAEGLCIGWCHDWDSDFDAFRLKDGSLAVNAGKSVNLLDGLNADHGVPQAETDFYGNALDASPDLGAHDTGADAPPEEYRAALTVQSVRPGTQYVLDTDGIDAGARYIVVKTDTSHGLWDTAAGNTVDQMGSQTVNSDNTLTPNGTVDNLLWTAEQSGAGIALKGSVSSRYLSLASAGKAQLSATAAALTITQAASAGTYTVAQGGNALAPSGNAFHAVSGAASYAFHFFKETTVSQTSDVYTVSAAGLEALVAQVGGLNEGDYSAATWTPVATALAAANTLLGQSHTFTNSQGANPQALSQAVAHKAALNGAAQALYDAVEGLASSDPNTYTIRFVIEGDFFTDDVYPPITGRANSAVTMPQGKAHANYTFSGWDQTLTKMPRGGATVTGSYTFNLTRKTYVLDTDGIDAGARYIVVKTDTSHGLWDTTARNMVDHMGGQTVNSDNTLTPNGTVDNLLWTAEQSGAGIALKGSVSSRYLSLASAGQAQLSATAAALTIIQIGSTGTYTVAQGGNALAPSGNAFHAVSGAASYGFHFFKETDAGANSQMAASAKSGTSDEPFDVEDLATHYFRIPAFVTLSNGWLVAASDVRWVTWNDAANNLDTIVSVSKDGGETWDWSVVNYYGDYDDDTHGITNNPNSFGITSASFIDPALVTTANGAVYMLVDAMPARVGNRGNGCVIGSESTGFDAQGRLIVARGGAGENAATAVSGYTYYVDLEGTAPTAQTVKESGAANRAVNAWPICAANGGQTGVWVDAFLNTYLLEDDGALHPFYLLQEGSGRLAQNNLFYQGSEWKAYPTMYTMLRSATVVGGALVWGEPRYLNVKNSASEGFLGVCPGRGQTVTLEDGTERILFAVYDNVTGNELASTIYSDDGGRTWTRGGRTADVTQVGKTSESQIVTLPDGTLRMYSRNTMDYIGYADSTDAGATWGAGRLDNDLFTSNSWNGGGCMVSFINLEGVLVGPDGQTYENLILASYSRIARRHGIVRIGTVDPETNVVTWLNPDETRYGGVQDRFTYSCITQARDANGNPLDRFHLVYEDSRDCITYVSLNSADLLGEGWQLVGAVPRPVPSVALSTGLVELELGDTATLTATAAPASSAVTWTTSDPAVVTVSGGVVTAVGAGSAYVTAAITTGQLTRAAKANVVVQDGANLTVPDKYLDPIVKTTDELTVTYTAPVDGLQALVAAIEGEGLSESKCTPATWQALQAALTAARAKTPASGSFQTGKNTTLQEETAAQAAAQAAAPGIAQAALALYTARWNLVVSGYSVTVTQPAAGSLSADKTEAVVDETVTLTVTVPAGYQVRRIGAAKVGDTSVGVAAVPAGPGRYTFAMPAYNVTVSAEIVPVTHSITVDLTALTADAPQEVASGAPLAVTLVPQQGYRLPETATVTMDGEPQTGAYDPATGVVTLAAVTGDVVITAQGVRNTPDAAVAVTGVRLDKTTQTLYSNHTPKTAQLTATVSPAEASNPALTWSTSDPAVATVSDTGLVTAVANGSATITVTTVDGGFTATCAVTVSTYSSGGGGGNVGGGGGSGGGGSVGGGGSTPSGGSTQPAAPGAEEDGTKTTTVTDRNGTVTQTVQYPDGKIAQTVTEKTGKVTRTVTQPSGARVETVALPWAGVTITVNDPQGETQAKVNIPAVLPVPDTRFADVPVGHWADRPVHNVAAMGLFQGTGENRFSGELEMNRGMMATVLHRLSGETELGENLFDDVADDSYYTRGVEWAASVGVIRGTGATTYEPERSVTRQEITTMLYRYAGFLGLDTGAAEMELSFADRDQVDAWAVDAMSWAVSNGLILGRDGDRLAPTETASRAEVATILTRFLALLSK